MTGRIRHLQDQPGSADFERYAAHSSDSNALSKEQCAAKQDKAIVGAGASGHHGLACLRQQLYG